MSIVVYKRVDLAANQFCTAIRLFLSGGDCFSVITLAGAADVIFCQLVSRRGKQNFTDYIIKEQNESRERNVVGKEINDLFFINALKHLDPEDDGYVEMNARESAIGAILKALPNYNMLEEKDPALIGAFLSWIRANLDPKKYNVNCDPNWKSTE